MTLRTKRAYEAAQASDGSRYLVDRLWPRGVTKGALALCGWLKELAPSDELRRWYGHDPERYPEFRRRFRQELRPHRTTLERLLEESRRGPVTLVYAAKDAERCNAGVLKELLEELGRGERPSEAASPRKGSRGGPRPTSGASRRARRTP